MRKHKIRSGQVKNQLHPTLHGTAWLWSSYRSLKTWRLSWASAEALYFGWSGFRFRSFFCWRFLYTTSFTFRTSRVHHCNNDPEENPLDFFCESRLVQIGTNCLRKGRIDGDTWHRGDKHPPVRNKIDLADPRQVRILKKRLGISAEDLMRVVEKAGNSISAVSKEVELQKTFPADQPKPVPPALITI